MFRCSVVADMVFEAVYGQRCALCGTSRVGARWFPPGVRTRGLRWMDRPHLCWECWSDLAATPQQGWLAGGGRLRLPVAAGTRTGGDLVKVVGAWKYHGLRGLAWPLGELAWQAWRNSSFGPGPARPLLVPIPLHRSRERRRGFNQAVLLARIVAGRSGAEVATELLRRSRRTAQQARLTDSGARIRNLQSAFTATQAGLDAAGERPLVLVDDLVTSGSTAAAAAASLIRAGYCVAGVLALGLAVRSGASGEAPVDTPGRGF